MSKDMQTKQYKLLTVLFLACIFILGIASDYKLIRYYQKGEPLNEEWTPELGRQNETDYAAVFFGKSLFVDGNGAIRRILGQREMNQVVRLKNDQLTRLKQEPVDEGVLLKEAANTAVLSHYLEERGIPFLLVIPPDKIRASDQQQILPEGYEDHSNEDIDFYLKACRDAGVEVLDIRSRMQEDGIDQYTQFYATDHHWTQDAGFYCYRQIAGWLKDNTEVELEEASLKEENYTKEVYKNCLLGSWGQRTGKLFAGADDITLYVPQYQSDVENLTFAKRGRMDEAVYNREYLREGHPDFIFDAVFDSTDQFIHYDAANETRIMTICDSFGRVVNPFLILGGKSLRFQSIYRSSEINAELIDAQKPDVVIMMFSPWYNLGNPGSFSFTLPGVLP